MQRFRVVLSGDFLRRDGKPAFPDFDLSPLRDDPRIDYGYLSTTGIVRAKDVMGFDALILMGSAFQRDSLPPDRAIRRTGARQNRVLTVRCRHHPRPKGKVGIRCRVPRSRS